MTRHVKFEFLEVLEGTLTNITGEGFVFGMGAPDVAVVSGVRCEGLPAVLTLERALAGMLSDMSAKDAGRGESLDKANIS